VYSVIQTTLSLITAIFRLFSLSSFLLLLASHPLLSAAFG
jgi:hypothetical protein